MGDGSNREKEIFEHALDLTSAEERQRYLESACGDDTVLLARVEALLRADAAGEEFLPEQPKETARIISEKAGDKIGRYKLLQQIGEGGCGVVYMAEQSEPARGAQDHQARHGHEECDRPLRGRAAGAGADGSSEHCLILRRRRDRDGTAVLCDGIGARGQDYRLLRRK